MARILAIDDEQQVREMLEEMLSSSGHEVSAASSGEEAIDLQRESPCDLVIVDMFMPGKHGLETIRELKTMDPGLKIIALSGGGGFRRFDKLEQALDAGATVTMKKPVDWEELMMTVGSLL